MANYTQFKIEAKHNSTEFVVLVKSWFGVWCSGYVNTNYFSITYYSIDDAKKAIEGYKNRFTTIESSN